MPTRAILRIKGKIDGGVLSPRTREEKEARVVKRLESPTLGERAMFFKCYRYNHLGLLQSSLGKT